MKSRDAIKIQTILTNEQSSLVNRMIGSLRFARNKLIDIVDEYYKENFTLLCGIKGALKNHLPYLKQKFEFIKEVPALTLQNMSIALEDSFVDYRDYLLAPQGRKIGKPSKKYKSKSKESITIPINTGNGITYDHVEQMLTFTKFKIDGEQSWFPVKLYKLPFDCKPEEVQSFIREITLTKDKYKPNVYSVSFSFGREATPVALAPLPTIKSFCKDTQTKRADVEPESFTEYAFDNMVSRALGIDRGIVNAAITSEGKTYGYSETWNKYDKRLVRAQRVVNRRMNMAKKRNGSTPKPKIVPIEFVNVKLSDEEIAQREEAKRKADEGKAKRKADKAAGILPPPKEKESRSKKDRFKSNKETRAPKGANERDDVKKIIDQKAHEFEVIKEHNAKNPVEYKPKGKNILKAQAKVAALYTKIKNVRTDHIRKMAYDIVVRSTKEIICLEDLNIQQMLKGKYSKSISGAYWGLLSQLIERKAVDYGKRVLYCGQYDPTTMTCSDCGFINRNLTVADRVWTCPICNKVHDRDINGANNVVTFAILKHISEILKSEFSSSDTVNTSKVGDVCAEPLSMDGIAVHADATPSLCAIAQNDPSVDGSNWEVSSVSGE
jgi:IS605 OrfB family transposase